MVFVFIPGFSQTASVWDAVGERLADAWKSLDVPSCESWKETLIALSESGGRGTYVGYSMGGRLALGIALELPELVEQLVMVSASCGIADEAERAQRKSSDGRWIELIRHRGSSVFLEQWLGQQIFSRLDRSGFDNRIEDEQRLVDQLRVLGQGVMPSYWERLHELGMPVTLIVGALDTTYRHLARDMADRIGPNARVRVIAEAGHPLIAEAPEGLATLLRR